MAPALLNVGAERTTRPVAAGQAGQVWHRVSQPGAGPAGGDTAARNVPLGRAGGSGKARRQRSCRVACSAPRRNLSATAAQLVCEYRQGVCSQSCRSGGVVSEPAVKRRGTERG